MRPRVSAAVLLSRERRRSPALQLCRNSWTGRVKDDFYTFNSVWWITIAIIFSNMYFLGWKVPVPHLNICGGRGDFFLPPRPRSCPSPKNEKNFVICFRVLSRLLLSPRAVGRSRSRCPRSTHKKSKSVRVPPSLRASQICRFVACPVIQVQRHSPFLSSFTLPLHHPHVNVPTQHFPVNKDFSRAPSPNLPSTFFLTAGLASRVSNEGGRRPYDGGRGSEIREISGCSAFAVS